MCVLKALRLWDQHACLQHLCTTLLAYLSLKQALRHVSSPSDSGVKKLHFAWHWTSKTKCREWITEWKERHPTLYSMFILSYQDWQPCPTRGWEFSVPVKSCVCCFGDQTSYRLKARAVHWIHLRSVLNAECTATLGQSRVKMHIASATSLPSKQYALKQRVTPTHAIWGIKEAFLSGFFFVGGSKGWLNGRRGI